MQILLSLFIIIFFSFSSHSFSEDISDFEIEGISVDEYVFKYFTNETLKNSKQKKDLFNYYKDSYGSSLAEDVNKANTGTFQVKVDADSNKLETYDEVQVEYFGTTEVIKSVSVNPIKIGAKKLVLAIIPFGSVHIKITKAKTAVPNASIPKAENADIKSSALS